MGLCLSASPCNGQLTLPPIICLFQGLLVGRRLLQQLPSPKHKTKPQVRVKREWILSCNMLLLQQGAQQKGPKPARGDAATWWGTWMERWEMNVSAFLHRGKNQMSALYQISCSIPVGLSYWWGGSWPSPVFMNWVSRFLCFWFFPPSCCRRSAILHFTGNNIFFIFSCGGVTFLLFFWFLFSKSWFRWSSFPPFSFPCFIVHLARQALAAHICASPSVLLEPGGIPLLRLLRVNKFSWNWTNTLIF